VSSDETEIRRTVLDYFEGWFDGDEARMERALHGDLVKRSHELGRLHDLGAADMVAATAAGRGREFDAGERRIAVRIVDVHGDIATAVVDSNVYREYLHLVRTPHGWRIANALWAFA
jgi:hypothetical protein